MNDIFYNYYIKKIDDVKHITITKYKHNSEIGQRDDCEP